MGVFSQVICMLLLLVTSTQAISYQTKSGQGARVAGKLNVHIVPHTHDDVGWLKTVDQYYMGANQTIQEAGVQYILDTVIEQLQKNPDRIFTYVEQAFFQRWWRQQTSDMQDVVKGLVKAGQLRFVNGGWCMHDEANTHYVAMVDQTALGHRYLKEQFDYLPTVGWQIDPFGHSSTQAALLSAETGFNALFFGRIDYQDSENRRPKKEMEMIWRASASLGKRADVFAGAFLSGNYGPPDSMCFDQYCDDAQPVQDDHRLEDYNVESRVEKFVQDALQYQSETQGEDIMFTMGSDFQYTDAVKWYKNLDKMIHYVNKDGRVNAFYSAPDIYAKSKHLNTNDTWPLKTDDFFPYADCPHCYWTGYFTSRPALKRMVRYSSNFLNVARQLQFLQPSSFAPLETSILSQFEEEVGVAQHHDAVAGTEKQHVAYDYARRLAIGTSVGEVLASTVLGQMLVGSGGADAPLLTQCRLLNESLCETSTTSANFAIVTYNALVQPVKQPLFIPIAGLTEVTVLNSTQGIVDFDIFPAFSTSPVCSSRRAARGALKEACESAAPYVLVFQAEVGAMGYATYFVQSQGSQQGPMKKQLIKAQKVVREEESVVVSNDEFSLEFNGTTKRLSHIVNLATGLSLPIDQQWLFYQGWADGEQNSGAYIFRPNPPNSPATPACAGQAIKLVVMKGAVVTEVRQTICSWISQTIRLTKGQPYVEFSYKVGPVPIEDGIGKEVITRFTTDIQSNKLFYTDSNGREMQERKLNFRPTWKLQVNEPVAGNYYPVNAATFIKDSTRQLSLLNDRSQGGASLVDGQLEMMVHRRLLVDDSRGVGEPLDETAACTPYPNFKRLGKGLVITGEFRLMVSTPSTAARLWRQQQSQVFSPLLPSFSPLTDSNNAQFWSQQYTLQASFVQASAIPVNVELMTMQMLAPKTVLLRVAHRFAVGEDAVLSQPATLNLQTFFPGAQINDCTELTLSGNQPKAGFTPWKWNVRGEEGDEMEVEEKKPASSLTVTLGPMQIKTFQIVLM